MTDEKKEKDKRILFGVLWIFSGKKYESKNDFSRAIENYQIEIKGETAWKADEIVIEKPEIKVFFERDWEYPPDDEIEFTLESENSENFTALDLLFRLNSEIADYDLGDFRFFEGLIFDSVNDRYILRLGS